ncbi:MAG: hypothetical protein V5A50_05175 [Thiohalorhabdus sp.]
MKHGSEPAKATKQEKIAQLQAQGPYDGYPAAHQGVEQPIGLLGGPIEANVTQEGSGVFVALPAKRELDSAVFGTPAMPRAFAGTPGITGVPPMVRGSEDGHYTRMKKVSPCGDKYAVMRGGELELQAVDTTATDAATSQDSVGFRASWQDKAGNTYGVRCCAKLATHGLEFPTFGGVMTNHILHGSSRIGTTLMPTEHTYLAFWGMGEVRKNGEVLDKPRLVHGMLTEYVRREAYELGMDSEVTPTKRHFHLMVAPMKPVMGEGKFRRQAVHTGFTLPNSKELPFWHVMFGSLKIQAQRG